MSGLWVPIAWNVALATVLAGAVALASCLNAVRHRPALRHTLWALVLLKLITPPLIPVPVLPSHPAESSVISSHGLQDLPSSSALQPLEDSRQDPGVPPIGDAEALASRALANSTANSQVDAAPEADRVRWPVLLVWPSVCGTLILVGWNVAQMFRVSGLLRRATPGGQRLKQLAAQAGSWVGTKVVPGIRVVDARVTPLLWARLRRPIIVLPRSLVDRLNDEQVSCIIRHEMAHHVRRDHWANAFGFAVVALFWWHPVVWWAWREMRIAQELCCDALALSGSDANRRSYAETLFQTLEFVQAERPLATMLGVGFGARYSITRRFEMIANASFKERGSWWTYAVVLGVVMVLPCLPTQGEPASDAEQFAGQLPAKITQLDIDSADLRQVIDVFGQPEDYLWGDETFEPDDLPRSYIMRYPGGFRVYMSAGQIVEVRHERASKYVYRGKLRVGSTLDEALAVLGPPDETVSGENNYKDRVLYKDIDGNEGHCYYLRTDQDVRLWFSDYKVIAIYMTRSDYGEDKSEPHDRAFWRRLTKQLEKLDIDSATREQVIEIFGQPEDYVWGNETFEPDDLPNNYIMRYPGDFRVFMSDGQIVEVRHERASKYVYRGKLRVGSTLDEALAVLGPPDETVSGENNYKDRVLYKDIDGNEGHCYYLRTDQDVRLWFSDYKVIAIYMTRSDYGEEGDAKRTPPQVAKTIEEARKNRPWISKTTTLDAEGRLRDKVDHPFVADADVVGSWKVVDFVREKDQFVAGKQRWQGDLDFLKGMRFDQDGTVAVRIEDRDWRKHGSKWTKGTVLHDHTASEYEITRADGQTYLFYQWKSGDYTIRYSKPAYYVLQKE